MNPFDLLGVSRDADATTIKRAYARLLKTTRPDENPQGFQRLHEAYQAALAWRERNSMPSIAAQHEGTQSEFKPIEPAEKITTVPDVAHEPEQPLHETAEAQSTPFSLGEFLQAVQDEAQSATPEQLTAWLQQQAIFFDLSLKTAVAEALHNALLGDALESLSELQLQAVAKFFGFEIPLLVSQRRGVRWAINRENTSYYGEPKSWVIRQLKYVQFDWRNLLVAILPHRSQRIASLGNALYGRYSGWPETLDYPQFVFHARLADPFYFGRWRWAQTGLRALIVGLLIAIPTAIFSPGNAPIVAAYASLFAFIVLLTIMGLYWWEAKWQNYARRIPPHWRNQLSMLPLYLGITNLGLSLVLNPHWPTILYWSAALLMSILAIFSMLLHRRRPWDVVRFLVGGIAFSAMLFLAIDSPRNDQLIFFVIPFITPAIFIVLFDMAYAYRYRIELHTILRTEWTTWASYISLAIGWIFFKVLDINK